MLRDTFQDPRAPYHEGGDMRTVQVHAPIPEPVPIGHFEPAGIEVVDEVVTRAEYLDRIQQACAEHGDGLTIRFYDHAGDAFDASVLDELDEIRSLSIDGMQHIHHPEAVGRLPKLIDLLFGAVGKHPPDILSALGVQRLEQFCLAETITPLIDLAPLGEARSLRKLRLLARGKNTEAIGNCTSLIELAIHATEKFSLGFINRLQRLEVLKFALGKIPSISAIGPLPNLRDLSFDEVRMLEDLGDLQRFPRLRRLQITHQKRLKTIRVGAGNLELEHIKLTDVDMIEGFSALPALKSLYNFDSRFAPDWSELPPTLTHFALVPKSPKAREAHEADVRARGLIPELHPDASFFHK